MYFKHVKKHAVLFMPNKIWIKKTKGETAFCLADRQWLEFNSMSWWQRCGKAETVLHCGWEYKLVQSSRKGSLISDKKSIWGFSGGSEVKNPLAMQETQERWVWSLLQGEEGLATHSSILAWKTPWTEEPGGLQSMGSQRVRFDWSDCAHAMNVYSLGPDSFALRYFSYWYYIHTFM